MNDEFIKDTSPSPEISSTEDCSSMGPRVSDVPPRSRVSDPTKRKKIRLTNEDYDKIVAYIEEPENFAALHGAGRKTRIGGGKCHTKATAFGIMAAQLSGRGGFPQVTGDELRKRFDRYVNMFKKAKELQNSTGGGLSEVEISQGMTMEDKLNNKCPHFFRMNAIFGERANIVPPAEGSYGLPSDEEIVGLDSQNVSRSFVADLDDDVDELLETDLPVEDDWNEGGNENVEDAPSVQEARNHLPRSTDVHSTDDVHVSPPEISPPEIPRSRVGQREKNTKPSLLSLYEISLKEKAMYRSEKSEFRMANLEEKKRSRDEKSRAKYMAIKEESRKRHTGLYLEMTREGKSWQEIEEAIERLDKL